MQEFPVVGALADQALYLESMVQDVEFAIRAVDELSRRPISVVANQPIENVDTTAIALWNAAAIAYARCFAQGARKSVAAALIPSDQELLKAHQALIGMRGDHIAHLARDNEHERLEAVGEVTGVTGDRAAVRVTVKGTKTLLPAPAELRAFARLLEHAASTLETMRRDALDRMSTALLELGGEAIAKAARGGTTIRIDS
jgi:hypothetical protein